MSATLPLPAAPAPGDPRTEAHRYAGAVRGHLDDLPGDVVEELAGGLEADLAELAAESSTPLADRLGDPGSYAAELRASAGLPPRSPRGGGRRPGVGAQVTAGLREDRDRALARLRSQRWWPGAVERARQLRPVWWVARGLVAWWVLTALFGSSGGLTGTFFAVVLVALSVEVGRRAWVGPWPRALVLAGNVLATLLLVPALAAGVAPQTVYVDNGYVSNDTFADTSTGVWVDGQQVTNLYPYDAQGAPLTGVQLLDDFGRPVNTTTGGAEDWSGELPRQLVPAVDDEGAVRWNSYPLRAQSQSATGAFAAPTVPPLPQPTLPALVGRQAAAGTGAEAAPATPGPTPMLTPGPTPTAPATP